VRAACLGRRGAFLFQNAIGLQHTKAAAGPEKIPHARLIRAPGLRNRWRCRSSPPPTLPHAAMPATPDDLFGFLDRLRIAHRTVTHPPLFTVEQSQALRGQIDGGHSKNLFLKDKNGALYLVVILEEARVDLKALPGLIGSGRLSFGSADLLREVLGVEPGSVTPFALINDAARRVMPVFDAVMMAQPVLNYHPLVNTMTTSIARDDLLRFAAATGHAPMIRAVAGPR
jgi:Ala-tRNA(Pro) deacylase